MVRIAISREAYDAISATLPLGSGLSNPTSTSGASASSGWSGSTGSA